MRPYTPRRCSKRWLDGDCPDGVLAIFDHPDCTDRYTIFYTEVLEDGRDLWMTYLGTNESLSFSGHEAIRAHQVAAYRYRNKHRYIHWTDLPEAVQGAVRRWLEPEQRAPSRIMRYVD
jgi:hypothetical protein